MLIGNKLNNRNLQGNVLLKVKQHLVNIVKLQAINTDDQMFTVKK